MNPIDTPIPSVDAGETRTAAIAGLHIPQAIIATTHGSEAEMHTGNDRSLMHDTWILRSADPELVYNSIVWLRHSATIGTGGQKLSDSEHADDNLTSKILAHSLLTGTLSNRVSARGVCEAAYNLNWLLRWRNSLGIGSLRELKRLHFDDFIECLSEGSQLSLLPIRQRIGSLQDYYLSSGSALPLQLHRRYGEVLDWSALASALGITKEALIRRRDLRIYLLEALSKFPPEMFSPELHARELERLPEPQDVDGQQRKLSDTTTGEALTLWHQLYQLSRLGKLNHDPLQFDPFAFTTAATLRKRIARAKERTPTIAPWDMMRLLDASARWVLDFSDAVAAAVAKTNLLFPYYRKMTSADIVTISKEFDDQLPEGMPKLLLTWHTAHMPKSGEASELRISVRQAVQYLMTATAILVAAFAMRRSVEVRSLKAGCVEASGSGTFFMGTYIAKTLQRFDRVPIPNIIAVALRNLEKLTSSTRELSGEGWLFQYDRQPGVDTQTAVAFDFGKLINEFATACELPPPEGQLSWDLAPHQLRRGGAIAYYYGFFLSNLDSLSRMLRHFDPEMTRIYIYEAIVGAMSELQQEIEARRKTAQRGLSDDDRSWLKQARSLLADLMARKAAFNEVRCEALVHRMLLVLDEEDVPIGLGASRLRSDLASLVSFAQADVRIGSGVNNPTAVREALLPHLHRYAREHFLEPVPGAAAHCLCRPGSEEDLARAACKDASLQHRTLGTSGASGSARDLPPVEFTNMYVCLGCTHCAVFKQGQDTLEQRRVHLAGLASDGATRSVRVASDDLLDDLIQATLLARQASSAS